MDGAIWQCARDAHVDVEQLALHSARGRCLLELPGPQPHPRPHPHRNPLTLTRTLTFTLTLTLTLLELPGVLA